MIVVIALPLVAWFTVLARDQQIGLAGVHRILEKGPSMSDRDWHQAMADLRAADLLDPSTDWSVARANYLLLRDRRGALRVADSVVRRDPNNLPAWMVILRTTRGDQPDRAARASRAVRRLNPPPQLHR